MLVEDFKSNYYIKGSIQGTNTTSNVGFDEEIYLRILIDKMNIERCKLIFVSIWIALIVTGLLGNGFVIFTIIKFKKFTNVTQCYLFNLSFADIAFVISCIPFTAYSYLNDTWIFGNFLCKTYHYFSLVTVCATCLTLMMMTIDRYNYVCNTRKQSWRNPGFVFYITCLIWIISLILGIPNLITYKVRQQDYLKDENGTFYKHEQLLECNQDRSYFSSMTPWYSITVSYFIPSLVLIVSYIKILHFMTLKTKKLAQNSTFNSKISMFRKKRVTKIVIFLTSNFIILWFPIHFLVTWYRLDNNFPEHYSLYILKMFAHTMSYANSSLNPIIYAFSNESFRHTIIHLFRKLFKRKGLDVYNHVNNRLVKSNEITQFL